jgi:hypothetical protein
VATRAHNDRLRKRLVAEIQRRQKKPWDPQTILYDDQLAVFEDSTPDRVLVGTRQLGKSLLAAVCHVDIGLTKPGSDSAFLDFDIEHAEKIILRDFETLLDAYDVPAKLVEGRLEFDNGSKCYVFSGRASEVKKLQGLKLALLTADESNDAEALEDIVRMVRPALMRHGGRILAMGIPGRVPKVGYWWAITEGNLASAYGQHRGDMRRNPYLPAAERERQIAKARAELGEESPEFQRHWLGQWPSGTNALQVFQYDTDRDGYDGPPPARRYYALGLDPGGVQDAEAIVIIGHGSPDGIIYVVDENVTDPGAGGSWADTGRRMGPLCDKWNCADAFYDYGSAHKSAMAVVADNDFRVTVDAVPFKDLDIEVPRINRLFAMGRLKIPRLSRLEEDLQKTAWDPKSRALGKNKQSSAWKQNLCDALRSALHAVEGYSAPPAPEVSEHEARQIRLRAEVQAAYEGIERDDYAKAFED